MHRLGDLRAAGWRTVPEGPGVYWWYFPTECLQTFRIAEFCNSAALNLRRSPDGQICLYHGMAKSLRERVEWHAAQKLGLSAMKSGFLSTFRLTLLTLNDFDYSAGAQQIDTFMDALAIEWQALPTQADAMAAEAGELANGSHYPLNIQANRRPELAAFVAHLKKARGEYRARYLGSSESVEAGSPEGAALDPQEPTDLPEHSHPNTLALISCTKSKADHPCPASELYSPSNFFKLAFEYARCNAGKVLILSAKHGAVRPEQVIAPYEQTLVGASRLERVRWAHMVHDQLRSLPEYEAAEQILWLAGENYRSELLPLVGADGKRSEVPMAGLPQGKQLAWLSGQRGGFAGMVANRPAPSKIWQPGWTGAVASVLSAVARGGAWLAQRATAPAARSRSAGAPTSDDFRRNLLRLKEEARASGRSELIISAGELHRVVGGYPGNNHRMPMCCNVLRQQMGKGDRVVAQPPKGKGASLRISYRLR